MTSAALREADNTAAAGLGDPSLSDVGEVARALGADLEKGLSRREAARRLAERGRNELRAAPRLPTWRRVLAQFQDPLVYLLLAATVVALVAWLIEGRGGWPTNAIVIAAVVVLNGVLGHVQEAKADHAVAALARMAAATSAVVRDGQPLRVASAELVAGDLLVLG
ncbi:MAG: cation-transporting P-type ATPase [Caldimonas sp.]